MAPNLTATMPMSCELGEAPRFYCGPAIDAKGRRPGQTASDIDFGIGDYQ